jgi:hypothetical protein
MKIKKLTILMAVAAIAAFMVLGPGEAIACDVTVTAGDGATAIQDAVDSASSGDTICLSGTFTTTSGPGGTSEVATVTIGTSGITVTSASAAILDGGVGPAFRLTNGLSDVTIVYLEIRNRTGFRGGGVEAWDMSTSNITIRHNNMHDLSYNAVLVGSEGGFVHDNWMVHSNYVSDVGFAGIELTNCEGCSILHNEIAVAFLGIVVQARSTSTTGVGSYDVVINGVHANNNMITESPIGIYALSFTGHPTAFTPITGASTLLRNVNMSNNRIEGGSSIWGVIFWAFNGAATAQNGKIMHNEIDCDSSGTGVVVAESGSGPGTVTNAKVVNNDFVHCLTEISPTADTKVPPGPFLP